VDAASTDGVVSTHLRTSEAPHIKALDELGFMFQFTSKIRDLRSPTPRGTLAVPGFNSPQGSETSEGSGEA